MTTIIQKLEKPQLTSQNSTDFLGDAVYDFLLLKQSSLQPKSVKTYTESLNVLISAFGSDRPVESITPVELVYFFGSIDRKPSGVFMVWQTSGFFFRWYFQSDPARNPMREIKMKRPKADPIKGITPEQVERILQKISGSSAPRDKAIIAVLFASGLRDREFCSLTVQDINAKTGLITVSAASAKGRKFRQVAIMGKPLSYLNRYLRRIPDPNPSAPLWQTRSGALITESGLRDIVSRSCKAAGLENFSFHDFRRGAALSMHRQGADIKTIGHFLGHADLKTTERYLALDETDTVKTAALFNPLS